MPRLRFLLAWLAAAGALLGVAAPVATGYAFLPGRYRWEVPRIPYYVESSALRVPAARAAAAWNELGLRVRFVRTTSRRRAFVLIGKAGPGCWGGVARPLVARERGISYVARARVGIAPACSLRLAEFIITHELGHVLGLGHERRKCALMNPSGDDDGISPQCGAQPLYLRTQDLIRADDGAGALALYRRPLATGQLTAYRIQISY